MMPRPFGSLQTSRFCPAELMRDHIGAVPVVDGPESMLLIGVSTVRDIVLPGAASRPEGKYRDLRRMVLNHERKCCPLLRLLIQ